MATPVAVPVPIPTPGPAPLRASTIPPTSTCIPDPPTNSNSHSHSKPNTNPQKRSWDPSAPSILWAHELRRENIQAANQMDSLQTILASANKSIAALHESVEHLTARIGDLEETGGDGGPNSGTTRGVGRVDAGSQGESELLRALMERVTGIEESRKSERVEMEKRIEGAEAEALVGIQGVLGRTDGLEKENTMLKERFVSQRAEMKTLGEKLDSVERVNGTLKGRVDTQDHEIKDLALKVGRLQTENLALKQIVGAADSKGKMGSRIDGMESEGAMFREKIEVLTNKVETLEKSGQVIMAGKVDGLQAENQALRHELGNASTEAKALNSKIDQMERWDVSFRNEIQTLSDKLKMLEKSGQLNMANTTSPGPRGRKRSLPEEEPDQDNDQESRIPNSMPTPRSNKGSVQRTATETTWSSLSDLDKPCVSKNSSSSRRSRRGGLEELKKDLGQVRQKGRTLQEYLDMTVSLRLRHKETPPEEWLFAFLAGLEDTQTEKHLKERIADIVKETPFLAWKVMTEGVRDIIRNQGVTKREPVDDIRRSSTPAKGGENRRDIKKKRRSIPIVPPDEEDALFVAQS
ncbi:hypothetical protein BJX70DRAFT_175458 [Aspergillus crustosus]